MARLGKLKGREERWSHKKAKSRILDFVFSEIRRDKKRSYSWRELMDLKRDGHGTKGRNWDISTTTLRRVLDRMVEEGYFRKLKGRSGKYEYKFTLDFLGRAVANYEAGRSVTIVPGHLSVDWLEKVGEDGARRETLLREASGYRLDEVRYLGRGNTYFAFPMNSMNDEEHATFLELDNAYDRLGIQLYKLSTDVVKRQMREVWNVFRQEECLRMHRNLIDGLYQACLDAVDFACLFFTDYEMLLFEDTRKLKESKSRRWEEAKRECEPMKGLQECLAEIRREEGNSECPERPYPRYVNVKGQSIDIQVSPSEVKTILDGYQKGVPHTLIASTIGLRTVDVKDFLEAWEIENSYPDSVSSDIQLLLTVYEVWMLDLLERLTRLRVISSPPAAIHSLSSSLR